MVLVDLTPKGCFVKGNDSKIVFGDPGGTLNVLLGASGYKNLGSKLVLSCSQAPEIIARMGGMKAEFIPILKKDSQAQ